METSAANAAESRRDPTQWTASEAAEDLLARIEDLVLAGGGPAGVSSALEEEGLAPETARALVAEVAAAAHAAGREEPTLAGEQALVLVPTLLYIRGRGPMAAVDPGRIDDLTAALEAQGLGRATALAVVADLAAAAQRAALVHLGRFRRLGVQAMGVGGLTTAFFAWAAAVDPPMRLWNVAVGLGCLGLFLFGLRLWQRSRALASVRFRPAVPGSARGRASGGQ